MEKIKFNKSTAITSSVDADDVRDIIAAAYGRDVTQVKETSKNVFDVETDEGGYAVQVKSILAAADDIVLFITVVPEDGDYIDTIIVDTEDQTATVI